MDQLSLFRRSYEEIAAELLAESLAANGNGYQSEEPAEQRSDGESKPAAEELQPTNGRGAAQPALFEKGEWWHEHWRGMPEFVQEDLAPIKTIYVHFESQEDYRAFGKLVGQSLTMNTRSIWYPEAEIGRTFNKRYIDAPPPPEEELGEDIEILEYREEF